MKQKFYITIVVIAILVIIVVGVFIYLNYQQNRALELANQAVSEYGIIFDEVKKGPATTPKFVSQFIEECDFLDYSYDEVWVAEKDIGEKEIGGKNHNVTVYVYVGLDGRVCAEAKLEEVIPGIFPVEDVFDSGCDWEPGLCKNICRSQNYYFDSNSKECKKYLESGISISKGCCTPPPFETLEECKSACVK